MILGNGTASARRAAEKTALPVPPALVIRWGWDLWCHSVPALTFLGILSQLEVAATTLCPLHSHQLLCLCSTVVALWHWASLVAGVYVLLWAITNEPELFSLPKTAPKPAQFLWVNSLCALWEGCGLFLYLDHHKVFLSALSWCS